jgi:hypothetical protein
LGAEQDEPEYIAEPLLLRPDAVDKPSWFAHQSRQDSREPVGADEPNDQSHKREDYQEDQTDQNLILIAFGKPVVAPMTF